MWPFYSLPRYSGRSERIGRLPASGLGRGLSPKVLVLRNPLPTSPGVPGEGKCNRPSTTMKSYTPSREATERPALHNGTRLTNLCADPSRLPIDCLELGHPSV